MNVPIAEIIVHENYVPNLLPNDIALIRLERPVNFSDFIRPICLPFGLELKEMNLKYIVAGFGQIENGKYFKSLTFRKNFHFKRFK